MPKTKCIILTGYMGAGKSTIGYLLADKMKCRFVDTDRLLVKQFQKPITRIFEEDGEPAFRKAEFDLLKKLVKQQNIVISTGGGTLAQEETFQLAFGSGIVVYLQAPVEVLFERAIFSRKDRPILNVPDTETVFKTKFSEREHYYNQAHLCVSTHQRNTSEVVHEILDRYPSVGLSS
ncbi:MAG: shikimate kinase [Cyanobacteria bacterium]|nr:shikimate kinase [Cyanobacteriota bacterium]